MDAISMAIGWLRGCGPLHFTACKFDACPFGKAERERRCLTAQPDCCEQMAVQLADMLEAEAARNQRDAGNAARQAQTLARDLTYMAEQMRLHKA